MADYSVNTGTKGTVMIRDTGSTVEFWIGCSDSQTRSGGIGWSGVVNGVAVGGSVAVAAGFGWVRVGVWVVGSTQSVSFTMNYTGTQGLGGPATATAYIDRTPAPPPATAPAAPSNLRLRAGSVTTTSFGVDYDRGANNGAAIDLDHAEWSRVSDGVVVWDDAPPGAVSPQHGPNGSPAGYSNPAGAGHALQPGVEYRVRVRSHNSAGWSAFSGYFTQRTLATAYVGKGGSFPPAAGVSVGKAGAFVTPQMLVGKAGGFVNAG